MKLRLDIDSNGSESAEPAKMFLGSAAAARQACPMRNKCRRETIRFSLREWIPTRDILPPEWTWFILAQVLRPLGQFLPSTLVGWPLGGSLNVVTFYWRNPDVRRQFRPGRLGLLQRGTDPDLRERRAVQFDWNDVRRRRPVDLRPAQPAEPCADPCWAGLCPGPIRRNRDGDPHGFTDSIALPRPSGELQCRNPEQPDGECLGVLLAG